MRMTILFVFLFLTLSLAVCGETHGWILAERINRSERFPASEIVNDFDVRALFKNHAVILGFHSDVHKLMYLGFEAEYIRLYDKTEKLSAIEFDPNLIETVLDLFSRFPQMTKSLVQVSPGLAIVKSDIQLISDLPFDWDIQTETLPLASERIAPGIPFEKSPLYPYLSNLQFNPVIFDTLEKISSDSLYDFDYHLSQNYHTRQSGSNEIFQVGNWLKQTLGDYGLKVTIQSYYPEYGDNICGDLVGSEDPEEVVIAGAHYDSRSTDSGDPTLRAPGADDNGSGSSAMLEMARVLGQSNVTFAKSVRFCFWTGEEQGLFGSNAYSRKMKAENAQILAYFNADMLGYKPSNKPITLGMKDSSVTEWLLDLSFEITATYVPELPVKLSSSCCSDYISFFNQGYPSIGYFENAGKASDYPNYHKSTDVITNVNFEQLELETRAILAAVMTFAVPI